MYEITKEIKKEIVAYCNKLSSNLNSDYLKDNYVAKNEFLEFIYLTCLETYRGTGVYTLTQEEVSILYAVKKQNELILNDIRDRKVKLIGINNKDVLIVEVNEVSIRPED